MDVSADKYKLDGNRLGCFPAVLNTLLGILRWPVRFLRSQKQNE
jgi:hypothetical protein